MLGALGYRQFWRPPAFYLFIIFSFFFPVIADNNSFTKTHPKI